MQDKNIAKKGVTIHPLVKTIVARFLYALQLSHLFVKILTGHVLRDFFLHDFALTKLENLHHFSNLCPKFRYIEIWLRK